MKKVIVTTTINPPTKAVRLFDQMPGWDLVVIGDLKTPKGYRLKRGVYLSPKDQENYDRRLSNAIGWNCIQRRNFGLLLAAEMRADVVALVDDDNIPLNGWGENLLIGKKTRMAVYKTSLPAFDPIGATNYPKLWHRGFPLQLLKNRSYTRKAAAFVTADVQADFWNGDPDIDAICRMEHAPHCRFKTSYFPFTSNKPAPFNSQNTFLSAELLPHYFLFPHVGRMDDIWAAYYVQALGFRAIFNKPSVYQERNPHNPIRDMRQEYLGYEFNLDLVKDTSKNSEAILSYLPARSKEAWTLYRKHFKTLSR